ncbi:hypothetical protein PVAND_017710, partial [Polypedilum vanderplanki]
AVIEDNEAQLEEIRLLRINVSKNENSKKPEDKIPGMVYATDFDYSIPSFSNESLAAKRVSSTTFVSSAHRDQSQMDKFDLSELRKSLPAIKEFNGDSAKWLSFERTVKLIQSEGQYNGQHMKHKVRGKLTGIAAQLVEPLFETHNWESIMETLREAFGNPQLIINSTREKVLEIKLPKALTHSAIVEASASISAYTQACQQAGTQSHDRALALAVYNQLGDRYREGYFSYFNLHYPLKYREERLDVLKEYLDSIKKTLPMGTFSTLDIKESKHKSNNLQLNTISSSN